MILNSRFPTTNNPKIKIFPPSGGIFLIKPAVCRSVKPKIYDKILNRQFLAGSKT